MYYEVICCTDCERSLCQRKSTDSRRDGKIVLRNECLISSGRLAQEEKKTMKKKKKEEVKLVAKNAMFLKRLYMLINMAFANLEIC